MKKLVVSLVSLFVAVCSVGGVCAAPSQTSEGVVVGNPIINGVEREDVVAQIVSIDEILATLDETVSSIIENLNNGEELSEILEDVDLDGIDNIDGEISDYAVLSDFIDLFLYDSATGERLENVTDVTLTWEVPQLVQSMDQVYVVHYSTVRNVWELIEPEDVDYENKTVTAHFEDLSPVAIIYKEAETTAAATTPAETTEESSSDNTPMIIGGVVVVVVIVAGYLFFKKKSAK